MFCYAYRSPRFARSHTLEAGIILFENSTFDIVAKILYPNEPYTEKNCISTQKMMVEFFLRTPQVKVGFLKRSNKTTPQFHARFGF